MNSAKLDRALAPPSPWLVDWFKRYTRFYLRRHFHGVWLARGDMPPGGPAPLVVYLNHSAWWDPLLCVLLVDKYLAERQHWAVIEQSQLQRYRFFARLGFVGIEPNSQLGARQLLALAEPLAARRDAALWLTPQGRFCDPRERPLRLAPGLGHLARRLPNAWFVPLALEYPFWYERLPEALARFGAPFCPAEHSRLQPSEYTELFGERLTATADALATLSIGRTISSFDRLLQGRAGVGGFYDLARRVAARSRGERFRAAHNDWDKP